MQADWTSIVPMESSKALNIAIGLQDQGCTNSGVFSRRVAMLVLLYAALVYSAFILGTSFVVLVVPNQVLQALIDFKPRTDFLISLPHF